MKENWKPVRGYEGKYEISDLGNIRSVTRRVPVKNGTRLVTGKILKQQLNHKGYLIVGLSTGTSVKTHTVHQLMYAAFNKDFVYGTEINHKKGKLVNILSELEISNPSHNQIHAVATGLKLKSGKSSKYNNVTYVKNPKAIKKWAGAIRHNGKSSFGWRTFHTEEEAAKHVDALLDSIGCTERKRNFP